MTDLDDLLAAYADGELDIAAAQDVERRIAVDPKARRLVELHRETVALLRSACAGPLYAAGAPGLVPAAGGPTRRLPRRTLGWAVAASFAAAIIGFGAGTIRGDAVTAEAPGSALLADIAEYHGVYSRETDHLVEIPVAQAGELTAWLGERIGRPLSVPDLGDSGLRFAGGRMLVSDARPVAQFMYRRKRGLPVAVCIARASGGDSAMHIERDGALQLADWRQNGLEYVVVGELDRDAIRAIAERVAAQVRI